MRLTRIRIKGFKSFADETELVFDRGVGVIVGPNGSGKSNIAESLRWAMASQAPSEVRVASGLDVLFSGSERRAAAGLAEVELVLEDEGGVAPGGRPELSIMRRLSRDGESAYLLNRLPVRRLDVHEVLADVGLGRDSHAIIGQNQVDQVLLASPSARRGLIEEVAGLGKYKRRRVRAQQKLSRVERQLVEARTRQAEIQGRLRPLALQASAAERAARRSAWRACRSRRASAVALSTSSRRRPRSTRPPPPWWPVGRPPRPRSGRSSPSRRPRRGSCSGSTPPSSGCATARWRSASAARSSPSTRSACGCARGG